MSDNDASGSTAGIDPGPQANTNPPAESADHRDPPRDAPAQKTASNDSSVDVLRLILEELKRGADCAESQRKSGIYAVVLAIFAIVLTIILAINDNRKTAERAENKIEASRFLAITVPEDGAQVSRAQKVRGTTPFLQLNHYVIVTLVRTGATYVQAEPVFVNSDGTFSGEARFGDIPVTDVDQLVLQVIALKGALSPGLLAKVPDEAMSSNRVSVYWAHSVPVAGAQIVITAPANGAEVDLDYTISGTTNSPNLNHYIVVTPLRVGTAFVQDQKATVNHADGTFTGRGRFGSAQVGVGEQFTVYVLATSTTLRAAPLVRAPADAIFSNSVTVIRKK